MQPLIANTIRTTLEGHVVDFVDLFPTLIAAAIIVYVGVVAGRKLQPVISDLGRRVELDETVRETPFGAFFPSGSGAVSRSFGVLLNYYVVAVAVFAAVEWVAMRTGTTTSWFVSTWAHDILSYVPPILLGIIVLFVGFFLANWATEQVSQSPVADRLESTLLLAGATKAFLYFVVLVIGLDTMGVDVTILHTFAQAFAYAVGLAVALAVGIAFGWGGKDYVAENIDGWLDRSRTVASDSAAITGDD